MIAFLSRWLLFVLLNLLAGSIAAIVAVRSTRATRSAGDLLANGLTLFFAQVVLIQTALGVVGWLNPWAVVALLAVIFGAIWLVARKQGWLEHVSTNWGEDLRSIGQFLNRARPRQAIFCLALWVAVGLALNALVVPTTFWDALSYHLPVPVSWMQSQRLTVAYVPLTDVANSYFPGNGELLYLWVLSPLRNDLLVRIVPWAMWLILGASLFRACRKLRVSPEGSLAASVMILFLPVVLAQATELALDLTSTVFFVLAFGHLLEFWQNPRSEPLIMFSLSAGLFMGVKYSAPAYWLLLMVGLAVALGQNRRAIGARGAFRYVLVFLLGTTLLGGYWYVRNTLLTGNPLYPVELGLFGHTILSGAFDEAHYFNRIALALGDIPPGVFAAASRISLGFPFLGCLVLAGLVVVLEAMRPQWASRAGRGPWATWGVVLMMLGGSLVLYVNSPYSTMQLFPGDTLDARHVAVGTRLGMISWVLCAMPVARMLDKHPRFLETLWLILGPFIAYPLLASYEMPILWDRLMSPQQALGAGILVAVGAFLLRVVPLSRFRPVGRAGPYRHAPVLLGVAAVLLAGVVLYGVRLFREQFRSDVYIGRYGETALAWEWVVDNVQNARVAFAGSALSYPLAGPDLQNQVRYVNIGSGLDDRYHRFEGADYRAAMDYGTWLGNLDQWGADYLVVSNTVEDEWAMAHPERFRTVYEDATTRVYQVLPSGQD